jgi:hypothetical protein
VKRRSFVFLSAAEGCFLGSFSDADSSLDYRIEQLDESE